MRAMSTNVAATSYPEPLRTIDEVVMVADVLERAAEKRYRMLADGMRLVGREDLSALFTSLAAEEQGHIESVARLSKSWSTDRPGCEFPHIALPEAWSLGESNSLGSLTPYRALSIAVQGEERAFSFWAYVASQASEASVRTQAETMARQELVHAAKLRHERRRAYHADPEARSVADSSEANVSLAEMGAETRQRQIAAVDFLAAASTRLQTMSDFASAELLRDAAEELAAHTVGDMVTTAVSDDRLITLWRIEASAAVGRAGILFDAVGHLEHLMERHLQMLSLSADAPVMERLQNAGDRISGHIARINARLYDVEPALAGMMASGAASAAAAGA